jgi:hypothetical protein
MFEGLASGLPARSAVFWLVLAVVAAACAPTPPPSGAAVESSTAPIPLRVGYWVQPEFQSARFTGARLEDVSFGDIMEHGLAELGMSTFRSSARFGSQAEALASPNIDAVVVPTIELLAINKDPEGFGAKEISTVQMQWRVSDRTGRVLWSNMVVTHLREACLIELCRKDFARRAVREHFEAAGAVMRSFPWWQRSR